MKTMLRGAGLLTGLVLALGACSDDGDTQTPAGTDATDPGNGGSTPGTSTPGTSTTPLYIGSTRVFTADASQGYLYTVASLDAATTVDLSKAVELKDAWVFGDAAPYFYTATIFEPTITRWTLDDSGAFQQGPVVSFANQGVAGAYAAASLPLWSKTKAFFVDNESAQVIVWNPDDMTVLGTIPVNTTKPAGLTGPADLAPILSIAIRSDKLLVSVFWASQSSGWTDYGNIVRLVAIDPNTNTVLSTTDDTRCGSGSPAGTATDGTTYFTPWDYHAAVRGVFGGTKGVASCGLKVAGNGGTFDTAYDVDLSSLVGGKPAGSAYLVNDTTMLLHVWNNTLVDATAANWIDDKRFGAGYTWYRWTIGSTTATEVAGQVPLGEGGEWQKIGDALFTYGSNDDFSKTTLQELTADGSLVTRITVPGYSTATIRAR